MLENFDINLIKFKNILRKYLKNFAIFKKFKKFIIIRFSLFQDKPALIDVFSLVESGSDTNCKSINRNLNDGAFQCPHFS